MSPEAARRPRPGGQRRRPRRDPARSGGPRRVLPLAAALVLLLLGSAAPACAHAALRATTPGEGTVLDRSPRHLTLTFTESVALSADSLRVYGPDGRRLATGGPAHAHGRPDTARATLPGGLGPGTYAVAWRVVSADSHPVSGAFTFSVGTPSPTPAAVPTATEDPLTAGLHAAARDLAYLGAVLLIGTAAFAALCRPPRRTPLRAPFLTGWWILLATTAALLLLRAPYESGTAPAEAFDPSSLARTANTRPGRALLARLALLMLCGALYLRLSRSRDRDSRTPAVIAVGTFLAVALALTWAAAQHAAAGIQVPVAMTSAVLHLLATATWLGGLTALLTTLYRSPAPLLPSTATRFSRVALISVTLLVVTGVYQSWRGLGSWQALTQTPYGRLLLGKLTLVALLPAAAARSRHWVTRRMTPVHTRAPHLTEAPPPPRSGEPTGLTERTKPPVPAVPPGPTQPPGPTGRTEPSEPSEPPGQTGPTDEPTGPTEATAEVTRRGLRRSVLVEAALGALVLLLTTALTGTQPGRTAAERAEPSAGALPAARVVTLPFDVGTPGGRGTVQITLDPGRAGENRVEAVVLARDGGPATVPGLRLTFTLTSRDVGPLDAALTDRGGYWDTAAFTLPLPGVWTMKATVRVSDVDQVTVSRRVRVTG